MAKEEEETKKDNETKNEVQLVEVTTQTAPAFKLPDGTVIGMEEYLVWIGNLVYKIDKNTG